MISPESKPIDYAGSEWLESLTIYQVDDLVTCPGKHGDLVLKITQIRPVRPGDYKFALHTQYVELSDQHGVIESNISAALIQLVKTEK